MSLPRPITGHSIPRERPSIVRLIQRVGLVGFWRHPFATVRRWRASRRWPRPEDFDRMSSQEFDAYVEKIGFDARIKAALAEPKADGVPADRERGLPTSTRVP
jgi:hypothetical protein